MNLSGIVAIAILVISGILLWVVMRRMQREMMISLRPMRAYESVKQRVGMAVEGGQQLHFTTGRGPLQGAAGPTSVAALEILETLAREGSETGVRPHITVGDGTLLLAAQGTLQQSYETVGRPQDYRPRDVQFLADRAFPLAYAAGVTAEIDALEIGSNIVAGRFGTEIGIIGGAAQRQRLVQIIGSDDPTAMAVATAFTGDVLWGEELFVAGAYINPTPSRLASARVQDILRWSLVAILLLAAVLEFAGIL